MITVAIAANNGLNAGIQLILITSLLDVVRVTKAGFRGAPKTFVVLTVRTRLRV